MRVEEFSLSSSGSFWHSRPSHWLWCCHGDCVIDRLVRLSTRYWALLLLLFMHTLYSYCNPIKIRSKTWFICRITHLLNIHLLVWATWEVSTDCSEFGNLFGNNSCCIEVLSSECVCSHSMCITAASLWNKAHWRCGADIVIKRQKLFHGMFQNSRCGRVEPVASPHAAAEVISCERWWFSTELLIRV